MLGVVTGIPMEFQFGTNWAVFSRFAGGVIGQTLAMEGMFAFFLESSFLGLFLFGEKRLSPRAIGSRRSRFLWAHGCRAISSSRLTPSCNIPVGYYKAPDGSLQLASFWDLVLNRWAFWQYAHNMGGAGITGCFVMTAVGAFYLLSKKSVEHGRIFVKVGVISACIFSVLQIFPTGDQQGKLVTDYQPATLAAMEGLFRGQTGAPIVILGQPECNRKSTTRLKFPAC